MARDGAAAAPAALAAKPAPVQPAPETAAPALESPEVIANLMMDKPDTNRMVNWGEPPAEPGQISLEAPLFWQDTPEIRADRQAIADGMAAAGASRSLAAELWGDVAAAATKPVTISEAAAMAQLRQIWGGQTDAKLGQARAAIAQMQAKYPGTAEYLSRTGLGNDPSFIRKIVTGVNRKGGR